MIISWRQRYHRMGILLIVIGLMMGCASFMEVIGGNTPPAAPRPDNGPFEYALSVYQGGDYTQAERLFNALATADKDDDQRYRAWLGEICCMLMLADSPQDVDTAMGTWRKLEASTSDDEWRAVVPLLAPLISRFSASTRNRTGQAQSPTVSAPPPRSQQKETELAAVKKKAARITQLQRQLDTVMGENQALKQKIKALEAIDQNIQKKKTEISAPTE